MSEDNCSDGVLKTRPALGDVTNRVSKRGFSLISGNSIVKSRDGYCENVKNKEEISKILTKVCRGEENLGKERCATILNFKDSGKKACVKSYTCSEINSLKGNVISSISKVQTEAKKPESSNVGLNLGRENALTESVVELGDASRDSFVSNKEFLDEGISCEVAKGNSVLEQLGNSVCLNDGNDVSLDDLDSTKCGSIEYSRLLESQESRSSGLERCVGLKGDGCSDSNAGVDLIKSCSCSFCTKAAYIWSDLHYQDIKGRMAALKKSQKEANVLVQRSLRSQGIEQHGQGNSNKISKLESDLMGQWRSLFLHMEDILGRESSQLEASLFTLKDLRDNCKTELESINGTASEKQ